MDPHKPSRPWRFEVPLDRRALRLRAGVAVLAVGVLVVFAARAGLRGALSGAVLGASGALLFGVLAYLSWAMSRIPGAPLVLDERGLLVNSGLREPAFVPWEAIDEVGLRRGRMGRRIVVRLRDNAAPELALPWICSHGAPPEWMAGLIETFRHRAMHKP